MERQSLNVFRMRLLGAEVRPVTSGTCTLKDATSEAIRDWVTNVETTHYILGSVAGPHPYPMMVRGHDSSMHACICLNGPFKIKHSGLTANHTSCAGGIAVSFLRTCYPACMLSCLHI